MNTKTLYGLDKNGGAKQWSVWSADNTVYVQHGKVGGKLTTKTTVCKGKNKGRSNATTDAEQALSEAQSKWNKQYDKYYRETLEEAESLTTEGVMLAQDYTKKPHFLDGEFYISPKLDGLRVKTTFVLGEPVWHSRGNKTYPVPKHLVEDLKTLNKAGYSTLDGEAYIHRIKLQKVQSCVKKPKELTKKVTYQIFDIPSKFLWTDRLLQLNSLRPLVEVMKMIDVVEQTYCTKGDLESKLKAYLDSDFEGIMMRNMKGKYEFQNNRSNDLLKYKLFFDDEAKVLSCTEDKNGQGKFLMEYKSPSTKKIVTFELSMNGSQEDNTYEKLSKRIGEWVNFKYQDFTEDGVPSFARGLYFRECTKDGVPLE